MHISRNTIRRVEVVHGFLAIPVGHFVSLQRDGVHLQPICAKTNY